MVIVSKLLHKYNISLEQLAKIYKYSSVESFRHSSRYMKYVKASEDIIKLMEQSVIDKVLKSLE